ncbi:tetraacyldisaccharide 4'-kinase [Bacteroidota bacterium]
MNRSKLIISQIVLFPFTFLYWLVVSLRNMLFNQEILESHEFDLPIISVGNITAGGTGKTPHTEYLVELFNKEKYVQAVLSRGYKRKTRDFLIADLSSTTKQIGDEAKQLKHKYPHLIVAVDRKRVHGIKELLKLATVPDLILLDDAFQHRFVKPGKSIVLMDYSRLVTDDALLPAGRLREPISALKRANIILITKSPATIKPIEMRSIVKRIGTGMHQHLFFSTIEYEGIYPVFDSCGPKTIEDLKQCASSVLLLTGIANPRPLRKFARGISPKLAELRYPDHHPFTYSDIEKIRKKITGMPGENAVILTTEKDGMRLMELEMEDELKEKLYYVQIKVKFVGEQNEEFDKIVLDYVRSNKRDNILHKKPNKSLT